MLRKIKLGKSGMEVPAVAVGCMRLTSLERADAEHFIGEALDEGANFFDHADIYGGGKCEELFAQAVHMNDDKREKLIIQSKCGIRRGMYDFSKKYILESVDGSLSRLHTDYLDVLALHRPDALMDPEEVAEAFDILEASGKVRHFGVSNMNTMQIKLLQKYVKQPICVDQLQFSITNCTMISSGINVNMQNEPAVMRDGSVLDFCRLEDITVQAWSPFQYGFFEGAFIGSPKFPELNKTLNTIAEKYNCTPTSIAAAWILRHPAVIQPISGTMNVHRLRDICHAADIALTREEWYEIYRSAGNMLP